MLALVFVCVLIQWVPALDIQPEETVSVSEAAGVVSGVARLPCDLTPTLPGDKVSLVIWYKDGTESPIYSLDARSRPLDEATHWADERTLGGRAFFKVSDVDTHLAVESIREIDGGSYRCRVDFSRSPTRNSLVKLAIIVPPHNLTLEDERGSELRRSVLGPYTEGIATQVTCTASGGRPAASVTWWQDGVLVDDSFEHLGEGRVRNTYHLEVLERRHLNSVLTCQASNNEVLPPLTASLNIDLYLRPLDVRLLGENQPLSAGNEYEVACQASGARPPAGISWWRGTQLLEHTRETTSPDGNVTTSVLTLAPMAEDSGKILACRAVNPHIPGSELNVAWPMDVQYPPIVTLQLGSSLNSSSIKEGVDVYIDCNILANPWINKLSWRHNGKPLVANASAGTLLSNQTLVLQVVTRNTSGAYTCLASNSEGVVESNPLYLDVKYGPVCRRGQQRLYGAARQETVSVGCEVDANPPATLFRWSFNNSRVQSLEVASVVAGGGRSVANYTPTTESDYGTLLCWGRNELGAQTHPCMFHLVPAGTPDAPRHCVLANRTSRSLHITCERGFDGGLPQTFTLELFAAGSGDSPKRLVFNVTSRSHPEFVVTGLEPGGGYFVTIYSSNGKGRSRDVETLSASTLKTSLQEHRRTPASSEPPVSIPPVSSLLWLAAGVVVALAAAGLAALIIYRARGGWCDGDESDGQRTTSASPETSLPPGGGKMCLGSGPPLTVALVRKGSPEGAGDMDVDERNPDVIPHNTEFEQHETRPPGPPTAAAFRAAVYDNTQQCSPRTLAATGVPVRWHHVMWREAETETEFSQQHSPQQQQSPAPSILKPAPSAIAPQVYLQQAVPMSPSRQMLYRSLPRPLKQNAETQTPSSALRHKESAV